MSLTCVPKRQRRAFNVIYTIQHYYWYVRRADNGCQQSVYAFATLMINMALDMIWICQATRHL